MAGKTIQLFTHHPRSWRENRYVYAVVSRRSHGLSIGIDLNPDKVCNFDCIYCCVDRAVEPRVREVDLDIMAGELDHMLALAASGRIYATEPFDQTPPEMRRLNDVAFSGSGEPTAYAKFAEACGLVADLVARHRLEETKLVVITNATLLHRPAVVRAMELLDRHKGEIWAKLDAGTEEHYRLVERTSIPLARVMENILSAGRVRPIVIQSLFMQVEGVGPSEGEIEAYVQRLRDLRDGGCRIKLVQVYTVARKTAEAFVAPLAEAALESIAGKVRGLGLPAEVYP